MGRTYKSIYHPAFPKKYRGNPNNIICRSNWERKFCNYCDMNKNILEWCSEEFFIPYRSPLDNRIHRYFQDFFMKVQESNGRTKGYVVEVKPKRQTMPPTKSSKKRQKTYINEVKTYTINEAKWNAAKEFCADRSLEFRIITEEELF